MDIVYVYRRFAGGRELQYSLRSACQNLTFDNAHIVGDTPPFRCNANLMNFRGPHGKHENGFSKLRHAVMSREVSDPFVLFNDDFFLLQSFDDLPYLHMGKLVDWIEHFPHRSAYYEKAVKTLSIVGDRAKIFETHSPIVYEKDKLKFLIKKHDLPAGIMLRSLYCHTFKIKGEQSSDYKARSASQITEYSTGRWFSTSEQCARTFTFKKLMGSLFPNPCMFEY